jgi:hypothetical protein
MATMEGTMRSKWRAAAAPVIAEVLRTTAGRSQREVRQALIAAYPFGQRSGWPYKSWLAEVRAQIPREWTRPPLNEAFGGLFAAEEEPP